MRKHLRAGSTLVAGAALILAAHAAPAPVVPADWKSYSDTANGFSISYPADWKLERRYSYVGFGPDHEIHGVAFAIPASMAAGTNLSSNMTTVSVETLPDKGICDARRFIPEPQDLKTLKNAGRVWSTANTADAGAGNLYDVAVFALPGTSPCLAVRYVIHSTNIGNYDPGTVKAFDRVALIRKFAAIRHTLRLKSDQ